MTPRDARHYHAPEQQPTPRTSPTRLISVIAGLLVVIACAWYYWSAQGSEEVPQVRTSVIMPVPVQAQLADGHILGARVALDLAADSPLTSDTEGGSSFLTSAEEIERVQAIIKGYVTVRGHEAFTGPNLTRAKREIGSRLARAGLGVTGMKLVDLTVIPPGGTWLMNT